MSSELTCVTSWSGIDSWESQSALGRTGERDRKVCFYFQFQAGCGMVVVVVGSGSGSGSLEGER